MQETLNFLVLCEAVGLLVLFVSTLALAAIIGVGFTVVALKELLK